MIASESLLRILAGTDTNDDDDVETREALVVALQEIGASFERFDGLDARNLRKRCDLARRLRVASRLSAFACGSQFSPRTFLQ
jgi:hypothetical protein